MCNYRADKFNTVPLVSWWWGKDIGASPCSEARSPGVQGQGKMDISAQEEGIGSSSV
jgi:hypothetical protein